MKLSIGCPIRNPPSLPKMKLPIGCPIWDPLKHEYYRFLIPMFLRLEGNVPPPSQEWKSWISGQCDILVLDDVPPPPPRNEKVWFQVKVTFLVLDDVPPPPGMKKLDLRSTWHFGSGWCTPPPPIDWNKHECYRKQLGSASTFYQSTLPPNGIILFYAWTGSWWISISIIYGYMDSNPICHPSPAQKLKCSFLDYVQLLMISWASWWTQTPSATPLQPKKWNVHFWIMFNFWWSAEQSSKKRWPKHKKMKKAP